MFGVCVCIRLSLSHFFSFSLSLSPPHFPSLLNCKEETVSGKFLFLLFKENKKSTTLLKSYLIFIFLQMNVLIFSAGIEPVK